jgi:hypothetical protein
MMMEPRRTEEASGKGTRLGTLAETRTWRCTLKGKFLLALIGLVFCCAPLRAQFVPDPANSSVSPADTFGGVIVCPDHPFQIPAAIETITLRNAANLPIPNLQVRLCVCASPPLVFCPGQTPCWSGTTNNLGLVQLSLGAGGCCIQPNAATVEWYDGTVWQLLRTYPWVKSPDYSGGGNLIVNVADLAYFWPPSPAKPCASYVPAPLANLLIFASAFSPTHHCP